MVYRQNKHISGKEKNNQPWRSKSSPGCLNSPYILYKKREENKFIFHNVCTRIVWPYVDFSVVILFLSFPVCYFCQLHSEDDEVATFGVSVNQAAGITDLEG